jgi:serine protease Do
MPAAPSLAPLIESVKAAVVNVEVLARSEVTGIAPFPLDDPWEEFFGLPFPGQPRLPDRPRVKRGIGSGFIVDGEQGLVLTNNHVVEGATSIRVKLDDGRSFDAKTLGRDPLTDVALLQLEGKPRDLPVVRLGDSDALRVGDWVVAIGNPFGLASSVSAGIISAKARYIGAGPYDDFLQTDAAINPGNSGGPLFNLSGEVVGINTAIAGQGTGIGFAVPSNLVKALLPQLEKTGAVTRGWLGVTVQNLTADLAQALNAPVKEGALVAEVAEEAPAAEAGVKRDDIIVELDGKKLASSNELTRLIALKSPGTEVQLGLYRDGRFLEVRAKLGTRPDFEGVNVERGDEGDRTSSERLGVLLQDIPPALAQARQLPEQGALVADVIPGSPAERAGLVPGMVIVEARGRRVSSAAELKRLLREARPGEAVLLRVHVEGSTVLRALTLPE